MPQFQYRDPTKAAREALNGYANMMNKRQKQADEQARLALADKRYQQQQDWQNKQWEHKLDREQTADARLDAKQAQDSYTNSLVAKMYGAKDTNELASTMKEISKNGGYNSNTIGSTYRQLHKDLQANDKQASSAQLLQNISKGRTTDNVSTYSDGNKYILSDADMNKQLAMSDLYDKKYANGKVNDGFISKLQGMVPQVQGHKYSKYDQANVLRSQIAGLDPTKYDVNSLNNAAANLEKVAGSSTNTAELNYRDRALAEKERGKLAADIVTKGIKGTEQYKTTAKSYNDKLNYITKQIAKSNYSKSKANGGSNTKYLTDVISYENKIKDMDLGSNDTKEAIRMYRNHINEGEDPKFIYEKFLASKDDGTFTDNKINKTKLVEQDVFLNGLKKKGGQSGLLQAQLAKVTANRDKALKELPEQIQGRAMTRDEKFTKLYEQASKNPVSSNIPVKKNIQPVIKKTPKITTKVISSDANNTVRNKEVKENQNMLLEKITIQQKLNKLKGSLTNRRTHAVNQTKTDEYNKLLSRLKTINSKLK